MMAAYAIILFAPLWDMATPWIYLTLPILPWTIQAFRILKKNFSEPVKLAPANLLTIRVHHLTGILFIIAYLIQGLQNGRDFQQAFFAVFTLTAFYLPAAVFVLFKNNNSQQPNDRTG
ncbi:MAG TPA: hypothetical protein PLV50_13095 [Smithella sp.]|nr:hypothetical protein [Smithella sp.]HOG91472.1 hypothetical protein [Smithella sp.]